MNGEEFLNSVPEFKELITHYDHALKALELDESLYCLCEMIEGSFKWYHDTALKCQKAGVKRVFDIGANLGIQRYFFEKLGIEYVPVDSYPMPNVNGALDGLIEKSYPFHIRAKEGDALVSNLCIGYLIKIEDCKKYLADFENVFIDYVLNRCNSEYA